MRRSVPQPITSRHHWRFVVLILLPLLTSPLACSRRQPQGEPVISVLTRDMATKVEPWTAEEAARIEQQVESFCGNCHATPRPEIFPRDAWPEEIQRGFGLYFESRRTDLEVPRIVDVVRYYRERAPESLDIPLPPPAAATSPMTWRRADGELGEKQLLPATSNLLWLPADAKRPARLLSGDMRLGDVRSVTLSSQTITDQRLLAKFAHIAHLEPADLDGDGQQDLLVSELGSFEPADQTGGKLIWLRGNSTSDDYQAHEIATGLGRVADGRAADFDGDGDLDLVVAEFGWHRTGRITIWWNERCTADEQQFRCQVIEPSPGTIHVPTCDLNGDGRPDFVALISQEQEAVVAFLNQGNGSFERKVLWQAHDPSFGSSGLELVDLDLDNDLDMLFTNGDTFDNMHIKPYHGVHVLWNDSELRFRHEFLTAMPGAYRAVAGDLDGDADIDIVVSAFLPQEPLTKFDMEQHHSLIWLERQPDGSYQRHALERGRFDHATLSLADFDSDGDLDLVVGEFPRAGDSPYPRFRWWWNESNRPETKGIDR